MNNNNQSSQQVSSLYCIRHSEVDPSQPEPVHTFQHLITSILAKHGNRAEQSDLNLQLAKSEDDICVLIAALSEETIMVARMYKACSNWFENVLVIVRIHPDSWIPEEIRYSQAIWEQFTRSAMFRHSHSNLSLLTELTEFIASYLRAEKWLEEGSPEKVIVDQSGSLTMSRSSYSKRAAGSGSSIWD